jgi:hypothetical protein
MSFAAANSTSEARSFSIGPLKAQILTYSVASGDTSGTVTADSLASISHILLDGGLVLSAAPTFSGNVATLAFVNPAATRYGTVIVCGK